MDYQVNLNNGISFVLSGATIDVNALTAEMNSNATNFIALGGGVVAKHLIASILPIESAPQTA